MKYVKNRQNSGGILIIIYIWIMSNSIDIFEIMKAGKEVRLDDPQYYRVMEVVARTIKLSATLNTSGDVNQVREILSEIIG